MVIEKHFEAHDPRLYGPYWGSGVHLDVKVSKFDLRYAVQSTERRSDRMGGVTLRVHVISTPYVAFGRRNMVTGKQERKFYHVGFPEVEVSETTVRQDLFNLHVCSTNPALRNVLDVYTDQQLIVELRRRGYNVSQGS